MTDSRQIAAMNIRTERAIGLMSWTSLDCIDAAILTTDGEVLIAPFGSHGLYGLDLDGELLWQRDFGDLNIKHAHGEGGSPVLYGETVVLAWDHEGPSFLIAVDRKTGLDRWRVERHQGTSWSTPIVVERNGKAQVIVAGTDRLRGHELATG